MSAPPLTSVNNPRIKAVGALQTNSRMRRRQGLFVIEGRREITMAIDAGYTIETLFYCPEAGATGDLPAHLSPTAGVRVAKPVFDRIAYRENSDGLLAIAQAKEHAIDSLNLPPRPIIIVAEAVEKPGNLGAILRTADAAGIDALIVCEPVTDIYNPNVVRASLGCLFTQQIALCSSPQALAWLRANNLRIYAAELLASQWYHQTDFTVPCAIAVGAEATGLSSFWLRHADARIKIPMRGRVDSLNVSVSTAVLAFEAIRQRTMNDER
ncbi:MAG: RNA methyltransferase [Prevotellaceae bacterium]|jgi:TrmH family RNA methyltransferase|nr:RNA methyltransferase [Prevotellaceae bacterium]